MWDNPAAPTAYPHGLRPWEAVARPGDAPGQVGVEFPRRVAYAPAEAMAHLPPEDARQLLQEWERECVLAEQRVEQMQATLRPTSCCPRALPAPWGWGRVSALSCPASLLGTNYAWGTLRAVLARGVGRWQYLSARLALLALLAVGALVVVGVATIASSLLAGAMAGDVPTAPEAASWADVAVIFGAAAYGLLPYLALAACVTILTRSSAAGMAFSLGYYFIEGIMVALLTNLFEWSQDVADFTLGTNLAAWMREAGSSGSVNFGALNPDPPGALHAFLVLLAYTVALVAIAFRVFLRRDVTGASGG